MIRNLLLGALLAVPLVLRGPASPPTRRFDWWGLTLAWTDGE